MNSVTYDKQAASTRAM